MTLYTLQLYNYYIHYTTTTHNTTTTLSDPRTVSDINAFMYQYLHLYCTLLHNRKLVNTTANSFEISAE